MAENLNLHKVGKEDPVPFLRDLFHHKFHGIKIVPNYEAETKCIILTLKSKYSSGYDEIMSIILKACASLSYIYNHSLYMGFSLIVLKHQ
jgi:hypothetical protein